MTVYARMPVLAFDLDASIPRVTAWDPKTGRTAINHENYVRLSPWSSEARQRITEIYEDRRNTPVSKVFCFMTMLS